MSEQPFSGESPDTPWAPPFDPELDTPPTAPPAPVVDTAPLSTVALAAAGVAALNLLLTLACALTWIMNEEMGLTIVWASNGLWLLLGVAGIGLGAYIQRRQKLALVKGGTAGTIATATVVSGGLIMSGAVLLPMISAIRAILAPGG